jgi:hypothetical protein
VADKQNESEQMCCVSVLSGEVYGLPCDVSKAAPTLGREKIYRTVFRAEWAGK